MPSNRRITLNVPQHFNLRSTIFSHGWCSLLPFRVQAEPLELRWMQRLADGTLVGIAVKGKDATDGAVILHTTSNAPLKRAHTAEIQFLARDVFQLSLDLAPFHARARRIAGYRWIARMGAGRLLRAPDIFEDVVKMILTTNCTWTLTELMNTRLVEALGDAGPGNARAFPLPSAIAACDETFLRASCTLGYRAPYVLEFARACADGRLALDSLRRSEAPSEEIYKTLRSIKGVGEYAASNLLRLLGRFDRLGLDSWCRATYARLHANGAATDEDIHMFYDRFGEYRGLAMWMDLTKEWYHDKFPI